MPESDLTPDEVLATLHEGDHFVATGMSGEWEVVRVEPEPRRCTTYVVAQQVGQEWNDKAFAGDRASRTVQPEHVDDRDNDSLPATVTARVDGEGDGDVGGTGSDEVNLDRPKTVVLRRDHARTPTE